MIKLKKTEKPRYEKDLEPVQLTDATIAFRKQALLKRMAEESFDALVIYGDLEHGSNFEYLTGFLPRFEEALLVLYPNGKAYAVLGNENLNKADKSRIDVTPVHMPYFSLPNQPMGNAGTVSEILAQTGIQNAANIGLAGWKNFTSRSEDNALISEIPNYLVEALKHICTRASFRNATYLFIGNQGIRTVNNANEAAHYEFGAALAGNCMLAAMEGIDIGKTEMEIGSLLETGGQRHSVVTIAATGRRFENANLYPTTKKISLGDPVSLTTGYKGGLQSRAGYAVHSADEMPTGQRDYLEKMAIPYQSAVVAWLESIHCGMRGKDLYQRIENTLPKEQYGWKLNPGHLCADEEWLSSPIYPESEEILKSGMLLQIDIIPCISGYGGASCESGILLADEQLRNSIRKDYPNVWKRVEKRRSYMQKALGIRLSADVLPTSMLTAYFRPYLLDKESALVNIAI